MKIEWGHDITNLDLEDNGYPLDESKEMAAKAVRNLKMVKRGFARFLLMNHEDRQWFRRGMFWADLLSEQQVDICILKMKDMTEKAIADQLNISRSTVRTQWKRSQSKGTEVMSIESK